MFKRRILMGLSMLLLAFGIISLPITTQAQEDRPNTLPTGTNFIFVNYIGQELYLDLDDQQYIVPGTATAPDGGRLALQLTPGEHKFAANVPGLPLGTAGEFTIEAGGVVAKSAFIDQTPPKVENGILIEGPRDFVNVVDFDPFAPAETEPQPVVDTWQPAPAPPGQGSLVWINYTGTDELTVDLNGQLYKVPPQANEIPGRLQVDVPPGLYTYTASVPNGSINGQVAVITGQVLGLEVSSVIVEPIEYDIGDEFDFLPEIALTVNRENLTAQASGTTEAAPSEAEQTAAPASTTTDTTSAPAETTPPDVTDTVAQPDGLLIKNFTGDTLVFTINNAVYTIVAGEEFNLALPPGQYNFTASLPSVARNGTVDLAAGETIELSIATTIAHDVLNVYQN